MPRFDPPREEIWMEPAAADAVWGLFTPVLGGAPEEKSFNAIAGGEVEEGAGDGAAAEEGGL